MTPTWVPHRVVIRGAPIGTGKIHSGQKAVAYVVRDLASSAGAWSAASPPARAPAGR
jgi:hypothetical protein